jgi:hypothetical protein
VTVVVVGCVVDVVVRTVVDVVVCAVVVVVCPVVAVDVCGVVGVVSDPLPTDPDVTVVVVLGGLLPLLTSRMTALFVGQRLPPEGRTLITCPLGVLGLAVCCSSTFVNPAAISSCAAWAALFPAIPLGTSRVELTADVAVVVVVVVVVVALDELPAAFDPDPWVRTMARMRAATTANAATPVAAA